MLNLIIFGPPGAGKGTQAELVAKKYKLTHLSSGDLLRQELKGGKLGKIIKQYQDSGRLVPDQIIVAMMEKAIKNGRKGRGLIFDGYPRNLKQAKHLDKFLEYHRITITKVLNIKLSETEASHRIILRGKNSGRSDDNLKTVRNRHEVYRAQTAPLLKYYQAQKKIITIDGRPTISKVFRTISDRIDEFKSNYFVGLATK